MKLVSLIGNEKVPIKSMIIIFLLGFLLRLSLIILYPNMPLLTDTINDYDPIASNLVAGNGFVDSEGQPDFIRGPGYPLFLATIYLLFGKNFIAVRLIQISIDSLAILLSMILSWLMFNNWDRANIVGFIIAIYPLTIYSSNLVGPETLFCFSFLLSIIFIVIAFRTDKIILFFLAGSLLAINTNVRSTTLFFPIMVGTWLAFSVETKRRFIYYFLALCFGFLLIIAPWTIRNFKVFHEFIPTVANGGNNFQAGSSIQYLIPLNERIKIKQQKGPKNSHEDIPTKKVSSPNEYDALNWRAGWRNYKNAWQQNPLSVMKLLIYKAARFWYATDSGRHQAIILLIQIPFLLMAIIGFILIIRNHIYSKELWLMAMAVVYFWGVFIVMFPLMRYSLPLLPLLSLFVSALARREPEKGILRS